MPSRKLAHPPCLRKRQKGRFKRRLLKMHRGIGGGSKRGSTMGWERRGNNSYYYRKKKVGGKVVSEYVGNGLAAQLIAQLDEEERLEGYEQARASKKEDEEFQSLDQQAAQASFLIQQIVEEFLVAAGFHKHRGQWRKARDDRKNRINRAI